jgi:hypothetical protein
MLLDGIYVMLKGKYIGPEHPGPWASIFYRLNIDVFRLGPVFVIFGLAWLIWLSALWANRSLAYPMGIVIAVMTLWYLPAGTFISLVVLVVLIFFRQRTGLIS